MFFKLLSFSIQAPPHVPSKTLCGVAHASLSHARGVHSTTPLGLSPPARTTAGQVAWRRAIATALCSIDASDRPGHLQFGTNIGLCNRTWFGLKPDRPWTHAPAFAAWTLSPTIYSAACASSACSPSSRMMLGTLASRNSCARTPLLSSAQYARTFTMRSARRMVAQVVRST